MRCPAGHLRRRVTSGEEVVACHIAIAQHLTGSSNLPHWEVVPSNCLGDSFLECVLWREECDKGWKNQIGAGRKYSSLQQKERINI